MRDYLISIVSKVTKLDYNFIANHLELDNNRINANINTKYSEVDAIYHNDDIYINIEVNTNKSEATERKNFRYICNMILKQVPPGVKDKLKKVIQINLNDYDVLGLGEFIYESTIMEVNHHIKRSDFMSIYDVNLEYLRKIDYNEIKDGYIDKLEGLLYIFVCEDKKIREELYSNDKLMDKVNEKIDDLTKAFGSLYDERREYRKAMLYELGTKDGIDQRNKEIAKKMLDEKMDNELITKITNLTKEELENL